MDEAVFEDIMTLCDGVIREKKDEWEGMSREEKEQWFYDFGHRHSHPAGGEA